MLEDSLKRELKRVGIDISNAIDMQGMLYNFACRGNAVEVFERNGYVQVNRHLSDPTMISLFNKTLSIQVNIITGSRQYIGMYYAKEPIR